MNQMVETQMQDDNISVIGDCAMQNLTIFCSALGPSISVQVPASERTREIIRGSNKRIEWIWSLRSKKKKREMPAFELSTQSTCI